MALLMASGLFSHCLGRQFWQFCENLLQYLKTNTALSYYRAVVYFVLLAHTIALFCYVVVGSRHEQSSKKEKKIKFTSRNCDKRSEWSRHSFVRSNRLFFHRTDYPLNALFRKATRAGVAFNQICNKSSAKMTPLVIRSQKVFYSCASGMQFDVRFLTVFSLFAHCINCAHELRWIKLHHHISFN